MILEKCYRKTFASSTAFFKIIQIKGDESDLQSFTEIERLGQNGYI